MKRMWKAWYDREVRFVAGRFEGQSGRILSTSRKRTVIVAIDAGQPSGGKCVKVNRSDVEPVERPVRPDSCHVEHHASLL